MSVKKKLVNQTLNTRHDFDPVFSERELMALAYYLSFFKLHRDIRNMKFALGKVKISLDGYSYVRDMMIVLRMGLRPSVSCNISGIDYLCEFDSIRELGVYMKINNVNFKMI